jgi:hypothetical protein
MPQNAVCTKTKVGQRRFSAPLLEVRLKVEAVGELQFPHSFFFAAILQIFAAGPNHVGCSWTTHSER